MNTSLRLLIEPLSSNEHQSQTINRAIVFQQTSVSDYHQSQTIGIVIVFQ